MNTSRLIIVVGPSGAGKDTVLRGWRARLENSSLPATSVHFVRRLITRAPDPQGEDHEPVSAADLDALQAQDELAFAWQAHGLRYAVRRSALAPLARGEWLLLNGSREHLPTLRQQAPGCRVVEISASAELLRQRLGQRAREDATAAQGRLQRATAPVQADLRLLNEGAAEECVEALHQWWLRLARSS